MLSLSPRVLLSLLPLSVFSFSRSLSHSPSPTPFFAPSPFLFLSPSLPMRLPTAPPLPRVAVKTATPCIPSPTEPARRPRRRRPKRSAGGGRSRARARPRPHVLPGAWAVITAIVRFSFETIRYKTNCKIQYKKTASISIASRVPYLRHACGDHGHGNCAELFDWPPLLLERPTYRHDNGSLPQIGVL